MLYEIMKSIKNYFPTSIREEGVFIIENGIASLDFVPEGAYILIEGSLFNDGVYQYPVSELTDEEFDGVITVLAPPKEFLELVDDIKEYKANNKANGLSSESFGGYSYSKATNSNGKLVGWADVFSTQLNIWRKI